MFLILILCNIKCFFVFICCFLNLLNTDNWAPIACCFYVIIIIIFLAFFLKINNMNWFFLFMFLEGALVSIHRDQRKEK